MKRTIRNIMMCLCLLLSMGVGAQGAQHWTLDPYAYQYDMTAYVTVAVMGNSVSDLSDYEVAAFCGEECRGVSKIQSVEKDGQPTMYGYLRIRSNQAQGENIIFKVYQKSLDVELVTFDNTVIFKSQDVIGLPSSPVIINTQEGKSTITFISEGVILQSEELNYDKPITLPADPEREGFTFKGWSPAVPEKVPATDQTFTAQWERNSYKLTFIVDGKSTVTTVAYEAAITKPADPVKVGYTFTGWDKDVASTMPASDVTYTAQFSINKYTMTFVLDNGQANVMKTQNYATDLTAPVPTKTGYTFAGWDVDVPKTIPAENKTFTAKWTINKYTMTFVLDNGQSNVVKTQNYATDLTAPVPTKTGFTFKGWSPAVPEKVPATDLTFTAQWERNSYKLTFIVDGKSTVTTVAYEAAITKPADPVKVGYTFTGWDKDVASTMPASDVTYTAQFGINQYTMTFVLDNGQANVMKTQNYATDLTAPVPTKTGYTFAGWDVDVPKTIPAENKTFTAKWTINKYTMTFVLDNGQSNVVKTQNYATDLTAPVPTKTGFTFKGWSPAVPEKVPATDQTFTAQWERNSYKLTFIVDGKSTVTTVAYEAAITKPADPVKVGYTFTGWDKDVASTMPASDVTYTAQFVINKYTMTFVLDNGQSNVVKIQDYATDLTAPVPTKTGYTFIGWDMDVPATVPAEDLTFTAQWERCYVQGDVNHDGNVDVTDVVIIIDHILLKKPANFDATVADVNHDGDIDVTDVVMVIDAILGKITLVRGVEASQKDLSAYTAFQMDLTIPAGYVLEGVELTKMAKDSHSLAYNMLADGRCRIVVFSMDNAALPGAWDEVIRLNLRGQGETLVNIDRAVFVTVGGERHELLINGTTSITQHSALNTQHSTTVYDLQGRKVKKTTKGLYIVNGKTIMGK